MKGTRDERWTVFPREVEERFSRVYHVAPVLIVWKAAENRKLLDTHM